jgi:hypothetical protein
VRCASTPGSRSQHEAARRRLARALAACRAQRMARRRCVRRLRQRRARGNGAQFRVRRDTIGSDYDTDFGTAWGQVRRRDFPD